MKKDKYLINHILYTVIQLTWGLPQNILAAVLWLCIKLKDPKRKCYMYHGAIVTHWGFHSSMGLGMFIFFGHVNTPGKYAQRVLVHEYGHTIQSCILGPLFIPVIGIPSMIWAFTPYFRRLRAEKEISYYDLYCEAWANYEGERVLKRPSPGNSKVKRA